jgi:hypothetical protein
MNSPMVSNISNNNRLNIIKLRSLNSPKFQVSRDPSGHEREADRGVMHE